MAKKVFTHKDATITLHLSTFGSYQSADIDCRNLHLTGLDEDSFVEALYEGIDPLARKNDSPATAPVAPSGGSD